ncbi:Hypothetical predicted protein [Paramuricea clavata]|uniref:Uncharacterized protein n=1 Tax=Paramuricea clavata TaxID=317549 RepID=A0A6S7JB73_PARCT|nr:Hypothetical predicted protein [Paramuricea clavata]
MHNESLRAQHGIWRTSITMQKGITEEENIVVTVNIPHKYLEQLYDLKQDGKLTGLLYIEEKEIARVSEAKNELETAKAVCDTLSKEKDNSNEQCEILSKELCTLQGAKKETE